MIERYWYWPRTMLMLSSTPQLGLGLVVGTRKYEGGYTSDEGDTPPRRQVAVVANLGPFCLVFTKEWDI